MLCYWRLNHPNIPLEDEKGMSGIPPLQIQDLSFRYHSRTEPAIKNITLSVEAGQVLLIAGASGLRQNHPCPLHQRSHPALL